MLRYGTMIAAISFISVLAVLASTHPQTLDDPFAPYDALAPGQPTSALNAYPCSYSAIPQNVLEDVSYCQIRPASGPILMVTVTARHETITRLSFSVEGLQVGHLAQRWGRPDEVQTSNGFAITRWGEEVQAMVQTIGWFTYQAAVEIVIVRQASGNTEPQAS